MWIALAHAATGGTRRFKTQPLTVYGTVTLIDAFTVRELFISFAMIV